MSNINPCPKCQCSDCVDKKICGDCRGCGNADTVNCRKYIKDENATWGLVLKK